jgi:hypothetical protein
MNLPLAMRIYNLWTERVFSMDGLENFLLLGMVATAVLVPIFARRRPAGAPYFSGLFALSLCPFLCAAAVVLYRIHSLLEYEDTSSVYVLERLQFPRQILLFGAALSLFSYGVYTAIYMLKRKAR